MDEIELGKATIVYEGPDGETVERTVENEHVVYFQDHWLLRTDGHESGPDTVRRIPAHRVFYVDRSVEAFEGEYGSLRHQIESLTDDIRRKLLGGSDPRGREDSIEIEVESETDEER